MTATEETNYKYILKFGEFVLTLFLGFGATFVAGLVTRDIWKWFITPVFHMSPITLGQAIGLGVVMMWANVSVLISLNLLPQKSGNDKVPGPVQIIVNTAVYLIAWGIFALWHIVIGWMS